MSGSARVGIATLVRRAAVASAVVVLAAGCATSVRTGATSDGRTSPSATNAVRTVSPGKAPIGPGTLACPGQTGGFELSLAASGTGAPSPVAAARWFVRHSGVPGYGSPTSRWRVIDPSDVASGEATLVDAARTPHSMYLHAMRLATRTWAVDSGRRCR